MVHKARAASVVTAIVASTLLLLGCSASTTVPGQAAAATPTAAQAQQAVRSTAPPRPTDTPAPTQTPLPAPTVEPTATPEPPLAPEIASATNPDQTKWYASPNVTVTFAKQGGVPVVGYGVVVDQSAGTDAPKEVTTKDAQATFGDLKDGTWYVHVRALGDNGLWSDTSTFQVNLDRVPLTVTTPKFSAFYFNPHFFTQDVWFDVSRPASVDVQISPAAGGKPVRTLHADQDKAGEVDLTWDGKDATGAFAPAGAYVFTVVATTPHGQKATSQASNVGVTNDRIVVSLSKQSLTAYEGDRPILQSLVTTGNAALPTPVGVFPILAKYHPFTFHSPWPKGSPFWYADSPVTYAMLFDNAGYYIHDAPWRHDFGPGSNARLGTPGQDYTGTHGCVNVPPDVAARLFSWAPTGTAVQVVP